MSSPEMRDLTLEELEFLSHIKYRGPLNGMSAINEMLMLLALPPHPLQKEDTDEQS